MTARWVVLAVLAACGGSSPPPAAPSPPPPEPAAPPAEDEATRVCAGMQRLADAGCPLSDIAPDECAPAYRAEEADPLVKAIGACVLAGGDCAATDACVEEVFASFEGDAAGPEYRTCEQSDVYAPVGLPRAEWEKRHGAGITRYDQIVTSPAQPVEVCGLEAQREWLVAATCADGSRPFADAQAASDARQGNVGAGGRCGSVIDHFVVPCPERAYDVYVDAYVCPLD